MGLSLFSECGADQSDKERGGYAKVSERWGKRRVKISKNCCPLNFNGSLMFVLYYDT